MKKITSLLFLVLGALLALSSHAFAAAGDVYYLSLPGITGDATAPDHRGQITVTGFQYPGLSGSSKSFYIQKQFDSASSALLMASVSGTTITTGTFYCEKAGSEKLGQRVFTMVFGGLIIDSWESYDSGVPDLIPAEKVSFTFSTLTLTSYPPHGSSAGITTTPIFYPPMDN